MYLLRLLLSKCHKLRGLKWQTQFSQFWRLDPMWRVLRATFHLNPSLRFLTSSGSWAIFLFLGLQITLITAFTLTWCSPFASLSTWSSSLYRHCPYIGLEATLLQYDHIITNSICDDTVPKKGPILMSWTSGLQHSFSGLWGKGVARPQFNPQQ